MRTIEIAVYELAELSEKAKAKAIEDYRKDFNVYQEMNEAIDKWKEVLEEKGFEKPDIRYSGFGSQGDGVSFTSRNIVNVKEVLALCPSSDIELKLVRSDSRYCHEMTVHVEAQSRSIEEEKLEEIENGANEIVRRICTEIYKDLESVYYAAISDDHIESIIGALQLEFFANGDIYV